MIPVCINNGRGKPNGKKRKIKISVECVHMKVNNRSIYNNTSISLNALLKKKKTKKKNHKGLRSFIVAF